MLGGTQPQGGTRRPRRAVLQQVSDKPVERGAEDRLGFQDYADALADMIDNVEIDTPLTIAISGPWGGGKTSLSNLVAEQLHRRTEARGVPSHIVCRFNAQANEQAPHLGAAFAADVARTANRHRRRLWRLFRPLPSAMLSTDERRRRRIGMALGCLTVALLLVLLPTFGELLRESFGPRQATRERLLELLGPAHATVVLALLAAFVLTRQVMGVAQSVAKFIDDPRSEAAKGTMGQISTQLGQLIHQATRAPSKWYQMPERRNPRRFVIFVDDLERCRPAGAVDVCDAAAQLLGHPNVVTVLVADMSKIAASAAVRHALENPGLVDGPAPSYGSEYMKKLVQNQFVLPKPSPGQITQMLESRAPHVEDSFGRQLGTSGARLLRAGLAAAALAMGMDYLRDHLDPSAPAVSLLDGIRWWPLLLTSYLFYAGAEAVVLLGKLRARRRFQAQCHIDDHIGRQVEDDLAMEELVARILPLVPSPGPWQRRADRLWAGGAARRSQRQHELVEQRVSRYLTDRSPHRREAEGELKRHMSMVPRDAKRMLNHLRLLLVIAERRQLFGGQPELCGRHLGKWAALHERWPFVGLALADDPPRIEEFEAVSSLEELEKALASCGLEGGATQPLLTFFQSPTKLAPVIERLARFQKADGDEPDGHSR
jgi:KAP family P-loop domain